jgi:hypothetical protein
VRDGMTLNISRAFLVWSSLWRARVKLCRGGVSASPPPRSPFRGSAAIAALAMVLSGCGSNASNEKTAATARDLLVSSEGTTRDGEPGMAVLASFALEFVLHAIMLDDEEDTIAQRYFVDAVFAPFAYDGRQYPPEATRAWVEQTEPLSRATRKDLEEIGFTVCNPDHDTERYCDEIVEPHEHLFLGIGERRRVSESRWSFDFGFGVMARSGTETGGARISIRSHEGAWLMTSASALWIDH